MDQLTFVYQAVMEENPNFEHPYEVTTRNPVSRGDSVEIEGDIFFVKSVWHRDNHTLIFVQMSPLKYVIEIDE